MWLNVLDTHESEMSGFFANLEARIIKAGSANKTIFKRWFLFTLLLKVYFDT